MISRAINTIFYLYNLLIIIRIFLTWIPNIDWYQQPFNFVRSITDPFLNIFRRVIPPIGMLDISPIVALLFLQLFQSLLFGFLNGLGL